MRVAVIGTINRDTVTLPDGTVKRGWGGMLYNLRAFAAVNPRLDIFPVANIGHDCYDAILAEVRKLQRVNANYLYPVCERNNHCILTYIDTEEKHEILRGGVRPLVWKDLAVLPQVDMILVNYISGRDIHPSTLLKLRRVFGGSIYIDIHSLTLGCRPSGERYLRAPSFWPQVVGVGDFIQMNRHELGVLTEQFDPESRTDFDIGPGLQLFFKVLVRFGLNVVHKVVLVTDGARGCYSAMYESGEVRVRFHALSSPIVDGDSTGCGDCFSAGFVAGWLDSHELSDAIAGGNVAGCLCARGGLR